VNIRRAAARNQNHVAFDSPVLALRYLSQTSRNGLKACGDLRLNRAPDLHAVEKSRHRLRKPARRLARTALAQRLRDLREWLEARFAQKQVEPNSGLGKAITYFLRHWKGLTAFLREAGAPLDNKLYERALKRAVLHRKNALLYRTLHGSEVGDLFMSLIHTCELCAANPFDYLSQLQRQPPNSSSIPLPGCPGIIGHRWPKTVSFRHLGATQAARNA